ncbi:MAG TPA: site-2 protease family protein [Candidatus Dormibacteraeota bacterium]|nr:site-2 protease family protein [Candidatus Dormibacteraeota bacterium]
MSQLSGQYPGPEERSPELSPPPPAYTYYPPPTSAAAAAPSMAPAPPGPPAPYGPPRQQRRGVVGWLMAVGVFILGYAKYAFLLIKGVPALLTLSTLFVSFGLYALYAGPAFAAALVGMILIHEMGHVVEIRRQGLKATAPVFIPFLGAAIFQRANPQNALRQAQIGIAGPIAGTIGASVAWVLYGYTGWSVFALAATLGFFLNLFNLIPVGMLDGGWITAPLSKWFQVFGLAVMAASVFFFGLSPILFIIVLFSLPTIIARFRNADAPYFKNVSTQGRWAIGAAWLALVVYLGFALVTSQQQLGSGIARFGH